jgi:UDP-glucose 4-epimerase
MSTLVTGATDFIGRHVVDRLEDRGDSVVCYESEPLDPGPLAAALTGHDVRGIVHAAGMSDPAPTSGTLTVLEAGRRAEFDGRVVLPSYAAAKTFADPHRYGLDVVSLRFGDAYGPGRLPSVLEKTIAAALARRPLRLVEGAEQPPYLIHVEDVARAIVAALDARSPVSRTYDIAGEPVVLEQVVAIVRDRLPDADIEVDPGSPADRELGYRPRWGLARGLDDVFAWREDEEAC